MMCFFSLYCIRFLFCFFFFFFNDTATTEIYTLSLHERSSDLEEMRGRYYGVGMGVIPRGERTVVMASYVGSPAFRAGIRPGDIIVNIDDKSVERLSTSEIADLLRGARGTPVRIAVSREGYAEQIGRAHV